jgi:hypothetical protein
MHERGVGRILVAALHQGIADQLPSRQEFYENWFTSAGLRQGTIGLAAIVAVLSFLRQEGTAYDAVSRRAGEYAGEWTVEGLNPFRRRLIRAFPRRTRARLALNVARDLVRTTYPGSRARVRIRRGAAEVLIRSSIFCGVREASSAPLCAFYAAATGRVLASFDLPSAVRVDGCRSMGARGCRLSVLLRPGQVR